MGYAIHNTYWEKQPGTGDFFVNCVGGYCVRICTYVGGEWEEKVSGLKATTFFIFKCQ